MGGRAHQPTECRGAAWRTATAAALCALRRMLFPKIFVCEITKNDADHDENYCYKCFHIIDNG